MLKKTKEQKTIIKAAKAGESMALRARAGSSKSTTFQMIVDAMPEKEFVYSSFNKHNCVEFEGRNNHNATVMTSHKIGYRLLADGKRLDVKGDKSTMLFRTLGIKGTRTINMQKAWDLFRLHGCTQEHDWELLLDYLSDDAKRGADCLFSFTDRLLEVSQRMYQITHTIDFVDMLYLPVHMNKPVYGFDQDVLLLDESHDFSVAALDLFRHISHSSMQVIAALDPMQNIYRSMGAGFNNLEDMISMFDLKVYPLTTCFRCKSEIIEVANRFVDDIRAHEEGGTVERLSELPNMLESDSMVLAPTNAMLVTEYLTRRLRGDRVVFRGRSFVEDVYKKVKKCKSGTLPQRLDTLTSKWEDTLETLPLTLGNEDRRQHLEACVETALTIKDNFSSVSELADFVEHEDDLKDPPDTIFSTIHRSKGSEADTVYLLLGGLEEGLGAVDKHGEPKHTIREDSAMLYYVGATRAKNTLYLVNVMSDELMELIERTHDAKYQKDFLDSLQ